jgi:hypothetical protein
MGLGVIPSITSRMYQPVMVLIITEIGRTDNTKNIP